MKHTCLFLFLTAFGMFSCGYSQSLRSNWWYFGSNAGCHFTSGAPTAVTTGTLSTVEGTASISTTGGALLFYTDGVTVYNSSLAIMTNGSGLMGSSSSTQSAIIIPRPGSASQYYLFTTPVGGGAMRYSIVDMTLSGGLGAVTATKNVALLAACNERICATYHTNGTDVWVLASESGTNRYFAYLITAGGISAPVISAGGPVTSATIGQMKFSPNGQFVGVADMFAGWTILFNFDKTTGAMSGYQMLNSGMGMCYGLAFSSDNTKLYATCSANYKDVYQWDLCATNIAGSMTFISTSASSWGGSMQLARDGKIYYSRYASGYLGVINSPNTTGTGCNYVDNGFFLAGRSTQLGLPNFLDSYLDCGGGCLPLEAMEYALDAVYRGNTKVDVQWKGLILDGLEKYHIERSTDGQKFAEVGAEIPGTGAQQEDIFTFTDGEAPAGRVFYRLRLELANGTEQFTEVAETRVTGEYMPSIIYPNPTAGNAELQLMCPESQMIVMSVYDVQGRTIMVQNMSLTVGANVIGLDAAAWPSGVYLVELKDAGGMVLVREKFTRH